jgi:hypothetical protein
MNDTVANELNQLVLKGFGRMTDWFSIVTCRKKTARNPSHAHGSGRDGLRAIHISTFQT